MNAPLKDVVRAATELTRAGKPAEATRLLQQALRPHGSETPAAGPPRTRLPLGETIVRLRSLRPGKAGPAQRPAPAGDPRFTQESFAGPAGARPYKLYRPARPARAVVVMLHGCSQNPDDFAAGTGMNALAEAHGLVIVYPQQLAAANQAACWNWFQPSDQGPGRGEPAILAGIVEQARTRHAVAVDRVFVAGLSAGGAMAAILGTAYPELISAVGVHSGLPVGAASDVASAFAAMRNGPPGHRRPAGAVRTIVFHGSADTTVHPVNGAQVARDALAALGAVGTEATISGRAPGGRGFTRRVVHDRDGRPAVEHWQIDGAGHAWSGGDGAGSFTDPAGPDASAEMVRFFLAD